MKAHLVTPQTIVDHGLCITDASFRNTNLRIQSDNGASYLLKKGGNADQAATVTNEAIFYEFAQPIPDTSGKGATRKLGRYLPAYFAYDSQSRTLILELLREAETLSEHQARTGRFAIGLAKQLGHALALLHFHIPSDNRHLCAALARLYPSQQPHWTLLIHLPSLRQLDSASGAAVQIIRVIQGSSEFCRLLDKLRGEWPAAPDTPGQQGSVSRITPIHCDVKWNNILVYARATGKGAATAIKLIDWEMVRLGDPCLDVGAIFGEYLACWVLSVPISGEEAADHFLDQARFPLAMMRPALGAFWSSYSRHSSLISFPDAADKYLIRAVQYSAIRLIQTAYERAQTMSQLTGSEVVLLQLALNILRRPAEAARTLLGIQLMRSREDTA